MLGCRAALHQIQCRIVVGADLLVERSVGGQGLLARREDLLELGCIDCEDVLELPELLVEIR